jgi:hypothetical protein
MDMVLLEPVELIMLCLLSVHYVHSLRRPSIKQVPKQKKLRNKDIKTLNMLPCLECIDPSVKCSVVTFIMLPSETI